MLKATPIAIRGTIPEAGRSIVVGVTGFKLTRQPLSEEDRRGCCPDARARWAGACVSSSPRPHSAVREEETQAQRARARRDKRGCTDVDKDYNVVALDCKDDFLNDTLNKSRERCKFY